VRLGKLRNFEIIAPTAYLHRGSEVIVSYGKLVGRRDLDLSRVRVSEASKFFAEPRKMLMTAEYLALNSCDIRKP
jgi:hypothetical protein